MVTLKKGQVIKNFKIVEVPIIFTDRTKGQSKMSGGIIREAVVGVIMLRLRNMIFTIKITYLLLDLMTKKPCFILLIHHTKS